MNKKHSKLNQWDPISVLRMIYSRQQYACAGMADSRIVRARLKRCIRGKNEAGQQRRPPNIYYFGDAAAAAGTPSNAGVKCVTPP